MGKKGKISDCSFIYLTVSKILNCGWQWLLIGDKIAYYSSVTIALMFSNVLHAIQIMHMFCMI